ncbi:MAG: topoisomerase IV, partial [Oscillospiraceae bacterium]|nr:topoisomerase IV [Oscillospiraceae bacterium]
LNREYILKRTQDIEDLEKQIADLEDILAKKGRVGSIIIKELEEVIKKYGQPRKTEIIYAADIEEEEEEEQIPDYPVNLFFSKEGYFKKITPQSLRMSSEQKFKEGDSLLQSVQTDNAKELLFFTNKCQVYKARVNDFKETKASSLGDYVGSKLGMDEGETATYMVVTSDYAGYMLFFFENGKAAKVELSAYKTKTNRKKLIKAYSDKSPTAAIIHVSEDSELVVVSSAGRHLLINTGAISSKSTKDTQGVGVMSLKKGQKVMEVRPYKAGEFAKAYRYKTKNLPAAGAFLSAEDKGEQLEITL